MILFLLYAVFKSYDMCNLRSHLCLDARYGQGVVESSVMFVCV